MASTKARARSVGSKAQSPPTPFSRVILWADALFLGMVGLVLAVLEFLGHFGSGPLARIFEGQPFSIGFFEAHALAMTIAVVLFWAGSSQQPAPWHLLAGGVHLILGGANLVFWSSFQVSDMVGPGVVATAAHGLFLIVHLVAYRVALHSQVEDTVRATVLS